MRQKMVHTFFTLAFNACGNVITVSKAFITLRKRKLHENIICAYYLYNLKNVKSTHRGVLLLGYFSRFFKLYKWHQISQLITFDPDFRQQERFVNKSLMGKMLNVV